MHICFSADELYFSLSEHIIYIIRCLDQMAYKNKKELFFSFILPHMSTIHKENNHHLAKKKRNRLYWEIKYATSTSIFIEMKNDSIKQNHKFFEMMMCSFHSTKNFIITKNTGLKIRDLQTILEIRRRSLGEKVSSFILMS